MKNIKISDGVINFKRVEILGKKYTEHDDVVVEVENTKNIDKQALMLLPKNIKIRVAYKGYDEIKVNTYHNYEYSPLIYDKNELSMIIERMEDIERGINPEWSEIQKAVYVYDKLKRKVIYTLGGEENYTNKESRSLRGLISGENVCAGYAIIYKEMMDRQGIACDHVSGFALDSETGEVSGAHSWNILKIDGLNIPVDLTWESSHYRYASNNKSFFADVDEFNKTHVPRPKETVQDYEKNLRGLDPDFVRNLQLTVRGNQGYDNRIGKATRKDKSKFIISLLRQNKNGLNEYLYADINQNGFPTNITTLFSETNIASLIEQYRRCDREHEKEKFEKLREGSIFVANELLSKQNIRRASANNGYIGMVKKEDGKYKIDSGLSKEEISELPKKIKTISRADGTSAILSKSHIATIAGNKVFGYVVYDIDSHVYMSAEKKDYYIVNSNRILSETDFENIDYASVREGTLAALFSNERIKRLQKNYGGYMGNVNLKEGTIQRNPGIEEKLKARAIRFKNSDVIMPKPVTYLRTQQSTKNISDKTTDALNNQGIVQIVKNNIDNISMEDIKNAERARNDIVAQVDKNRNI